MNVVSNVSVVPVPMGEKIDAIVLDGAVYVVRWNSGHPW